MAGLGLSSFEHCERVLIGFLACVADNRRRDVGLVEVLHRFHHRLDGFARLG